MKSQFTTPKKSGKWITPLFAMAIGGMLLLTTGCASSKLPPTESVRAAEQAIDTAERARVSQYAAAELMQARDILSRARLAIKSQDMVEAERLAQQSKVTAQLAFSRAELIKAQQINAEMYKSITQLEQEIQHNQGVNP
ncbi:DUF4398 domain-containing protein [Aliiglaciecola sp. CAU 1673]|uniref:DUF4398 domain-containing protein n=1 Tax=Aliiglaciecola sp. CAU 1673 TaxID=3032595 RepID=UPI0023DC8B7A|nr:DUF4398 domain-containing protein [Aliiglaciecola sp. CAU 1673]MDF2180369.1 DUF4398 domain-containing protein [Aliiglaciecola sp. CAU 1673]